MKEKLMIKFNFVTNLAILFVLIFGGAIWADSNGVWHLASDIQGGVFGSDEGTPEYTFNNDVTFNTKLKSGIYSIDIDSLTTLNEVHMNKVYSNYGEISGDLKITGNVNVNTITGSEGFSLGYTSTNVYDDATLNSPYSRINADSFHTNGLGVGQIYIEGRAIDANSVIYIGTGKAGGQTAKTVYINDPRDASGNQLATKSYVDSNGGVPAGSIMAFYLSSCPSGWIAADGSSGTPDLRGQFIRGMNNFGTGTRSDGKQDPTSRTLGSWQADAFKIHSHRQTIQAPDWDAGRPAGTRTHSVGGPASRYGGQIGDDTGQSTRNTGGSETRPRNVALIYCMKQ